MRHRGRGFNCEIAETVCVSELQEFIEFSLVTDRAAHSCANVRAARRAGAMIRIDHHVIWEVEIEIVKCVKLLLRELSRELLA